jgi:hypothetical protein
MMPTSESVYSAIADLVLVLHAGFVAFVLLALVAIWVGGWRSWRFVRNPWFRVGHLAAIAVVAAEAVAGLICPLTTWENQLRVLAGGGDRYAESFIQHWLHQVIFFDFHQSVFTWSYVAFFLVVALSFWWVPVDWHRSETKSRAPRA